MNNPFRPSGRVVVADQAVPRNLNGEKLQNRQFVRLVATKKTFTDCDFSYSHFESAYLRNCIFDGCKFIGCTFTHSNLRRTRFDGCVFDYAEFSHTQVEPDILDTGCPGHENLQQKFARALRVNFHQIGDAAAANKAIRVELEAAKVHLHKAWRSRESYYRKKHPGLKRVSAFFEWLQFVVLDAYWGNGESPLKLFRSLAIVAILIGLGDVYFLRDPTLLESYLAALTTAPQVLLGVIQPVTFSGFALTLIAGMRYIMLACLVSILVKRLSRR